MPSITGLNCADDEDPLALFFESVSELTERIKRSLESDFVEVALHGEVSNVTRPRSGHVYFTLRDDAASIRAVLWKNDVRRLAFELTDGLSVRSLAVLRCTRRAVTIRLSCARSSPKESGPLSWHSASATLDYYRRVCLNHRESDHCHAIRVASSSSAARPARRFVTCFRLSAAVGAVLES